MNYYLYLPIAIMALAACNAPNGRADARPEAASQSSPVQAPRDCRNNSLELVLTPSRPEITLGEPAVILVGLRNCTATVAEVPEDMTPEPDRSALQLMIAPPAGEPYRYLPPRRARTRPVTILLKRGDSRGEVAHVYLGWQSQWLLNAPGVYRFQGRLSMSTRTIEATPAEVKVRPAPSSVTPEDLASVSPLLGHALYFDGAKATDAASILGTNRVLDYLRPFARVAEVMARSEQQYDAKAEKFFFPQCADFVAEAAAIVRAVPDPYFSAVAASRLNRCLSGLGKAEAGGELLQIVRTAHPRISTHPALADLLGAGPARR